MEFQEDTPATAREVALGDAEHVTLLPAHGDIDATTPTAINSETNRAFSFDTESTEAAARTAELHNGHHHLALAISIVCVVLFGGVLLGAYLLSR